MSWSAGTVEVTVVSVVSVDVVDSSEGSSAETVGESIAITTGPEAINFFSCSTQLSMKFILLINVKMPTIGRNCS